MVGTSKYVQNTVPKQMLSYKILSAGLKMQIKRQKQNKNQTNSAAVARAVVAESVSAP